MSVETDSASKTSGRRRRGKKVNIHSDGFEVQKQEKEKEKGQEKEQLHMNNIESFVTLSSNYGDSDDVVSDQQMLRNMFVDIDTMEQVSFIAVALAWS